MHSSRTSCVPQRIVETDRRRSQVNRLDGVDMEIVAEQERQRVPQGRGPALRCVKGPSRVQWFALPDPLDVVSDR